MIQNMTDNPSLELPGLDHKVLVKLRERLPMVDSNATPKDLAHTVRTLHELMGDCLG